MIIESYTFEEHVKNNVNDPKDFWGRMHSFEWRPKVFLLWNIHDYNSEIDTWVKETKFAGHFNQSFVCQIDFEDETDAMAFKLRWI